MALKSLKKTWNYAALVNYSAPDKPRLWEFKVADLQRDKGLLDDVQKAAAILHSRYPAAISPLLSRWLPNHDQYLNV